MNGFSAITAANGWLIAALGLAVVFFGLASLALLVSFFPRVLGSAVAAGVLWSFVG
ncbi:MAG: hypothetical protein JSU72_02430 [Deltaproteobacteria bacterium]|nr:MAG: hypothetical protein JSU72_02430 [Deltaproteobacteria bacterium]